MNDLSEKCKLKVRMTTRLSDISSTIRASYHKIGERNIIKNIIDGGGYEGIIEVTMNENANIKFLGSIYGQGTGYAGCVFGKDGLSPSITANSGGNTQPLVVDEDVKAEETSEKTAILPVIKGEIIQGGLQEHQKPRTDGISPSITAACGMGGGQTPIFTERYRTRYRIRKFTPKECGRLMGVKDSDIDRMAEVNSDTQLYKQFGNSIVVDVMCAMFRKLNIKGVGKDG